MRGVLGVYKMVLYHGFLCVLWTFVAFCVRLLLVFGVLWTITLLLALVAVFVGFYHPDWLVHDFWPWAIVKKPPDFVLSDQGDLAGCATSCMSVVLDVGLPNLFLVVLDNFHRLGIEMAESPVKLDVVPSYSPSVLLNLWNYPFNVRHRLSIP